MNLSVNLNHFRRFCLVAITITAVIVISPEEAVAQIRSDNTLGNGRSQITPTTRIRNGRTERIHGGVTRGENLFHSFEQFNIDKYQHVYFDNPNGIENIFSRVTGENASIISGVLEVGGSANLFFLNPNGIIFGQNARLDIRGSFIATTAEQFVFSDGNTFSEVNPESSDLLTVNVPVGVQFGNRAASIRNTAQALGLNGRADQAIVLLGGGIIFNNGVLFTTSPSPVDPQFSILSGRIELSSVAANSYLGLRDTREGWSLVHSPNQNYRNIRLMSRDSSGDPLLQSSSLYLYGRNTVAENFEVLASNINLLASDSIRLRDTDILVNNLKLQSEVIHLSNFSDISTIDRGGSILIDSIRLHLRNSSTIRADSTNQMEGNIEVNVRDSVRLSDASRISNLATISNGGNQIINTGRLIIEEGSIVSSETQGTGDAGNININANALVLRGINIATDGQVRPSRIVAQTTNSGDAGSIEIDANQLIIQKGGLISASTTGRGDGGQITINADSVNLSGAVNDTNFRSSLDTETTGLGDAGSINIYTEQLVVRNRAEITTQNTIGRDAADIDIDNLGDAGELDIRATSIRLNEGNLISTTSSGQGGDITLEVYDSLRLENGSQISTTAGQSNAGGDGGNISIETDFIVANRSSDNNDITANAFQGRGGQITIRTPGLFRLLQTRPDVTRQLLRSNTSNFDPEATFRGIFGLQVLTLSELEQLNPPRDRPDPDDPPKPENLDTNDITAISLTNPTLSGDVVFQTPDIDPSEGTIELPTTLVDTDRLLDADLCELSTESSFITAGRGGLPPTPTDLFESNDIWQDQRLISVDEALSTQEDTISSTHILSSSSGLVTESILPIEAQGWQRDDAGRIVLVAHGTDSDTQDTWSPSALSCQNTATVN